MFRGQKPSPEVLEASVKAKKTYKDKPVETPGWKPQVGQWRKGFGGNRLATVLDMEERAKTATEKLTEEREQASGQDRCPF